MRDPSSEPRKLLTVDEVAELFQVSASTVRDLCTKREWPHVRLGRAIRFSEDNLREIVEIQTVRASIETRRVNDLMARTGLTRRSAERAVRERLGR